MTPFVSTIEVSRRPEQVFAYATDPLHFTEWQPDVVSVRMLSDSRFATIRRMTGGRRTIVQEITRNQPPHAWAARGVAGPIRPHATITVEPAADGSKVTFTLDFEGHGIGVPLIPLVRRQAEKAAPTSYRNLKRLLESTR